MNDRKTIKPNLFKENLNAFIDDLNNGAPKCKLILVEPNESNDFIDTYMVEYRKIRKESSKNKKNVFYYSIPENIGDYHFFKKKGMMLDKVHPNEKGNEVIGKSLFGFYEKIKEE